MGHEIAQIARLIVVIELAIDAELLTASVTRRSISKLIEEPWGTSKRKMHRLQSHLLIASSPASAKQTRSKIHRAVRNLAGRQIGHFVSRRPRDAVDVDALQRRKRAAPSRAECYTASSLRGRHCQDMGQPRCRGRD